MRCAQQSCVWFSTPWVRAVVAIVFLINSLGANLVLAQVITNIAPDTTLPTNSVVMPSGNVFDITEGTAISNNIFHSFQDFSVGTGDTANFVDPGGIANILSRVTGTNVSNIFGQLRSDSSANLFFLNPNGVVFGPNSSLDVGGSFHVSTADFVKLGDGPGLFSASDPTADVLISASPSAFGFLDGNPIGVAIQESSLEVPEGQTFSVISGDIEIKGPGFDGPAQVTAPSGQINIASIASAGGVILAGSSDIKVDGFARLGGITLSDQALLDVSGNGGGTVVIRGGRLTVDASRIFADTLGDMDGALVGIDIEVNELDIRIPNEIVVRNFPLVTTDTFGAGDAGNIRITADTFELANADIRSIAFDQGDAGDIVVDVGTLTLTGGAQINSETLGSAGAGGDVTVTAKGTVSIDGRDDVPQLNGDINPSGLNSRVGNFVTGNGGTITLTSPNLIMDQGAIATFTIGDGNAGDIFVDVGTLTLSNAGRINTTTFTSGQGGTITVTATGAVTMTGIFVEEDGRRQGSGLNSGARGSGDAGAITLTAPIVIIAEGAAIEALTAGTMDDGDGNASDITLNVNTLEVTDGTIISSSISPDAGAGDAGKVTVQGVIGTPQSQASTITLHNATVTTAVSPRNGASQAGFFGDGAGGQIQMAANQVITLTDSIISASVNDIPAGTVPNEGLADITLTTPDLSITGSGITAQTTGSRNAGSITISGNSLKLTDGAEISTETKRIGNAGSITLNVNSLNANIAPNGDPMDSAKPVTISSSSTGFDTNGDGVVTTFQNGTGQNDNLATGSAGEVTIQRFDGQSPTTRSINLASTKISTEALGDGQGGSITINNSGNITFTNTTLSANVHDAVDDNTSNARGDINVTTPENLTFVGGGISALSTGTRDAGQITLNVGTLTTSQGTKDVQVADRMTKRVRLSSVSFDSGEEPGSGNAGSVTIVANHNTSGKIKLTDTDIDTRSFGDGQGGSIELTADKNLTDAITLKRSSIEATVREAPTNEANDGPNMGLANVTLASPTIKIIDLSVQIEDITNIDVSTFGNRNSGKVTLLATSEILLENGDIRSITRGKGEGGSVNIIAPEGLITLKDYRFTGDAFSADGNGGDLLINGKNLTITGGLLFATTNGPGNGGNITLDAAETIILKNPAIGIFATKKGNAGNLSVRAKTLDIQDTRTETDFIVEEIFADTSGEGNAGNITFNIDALHINVDPNGNPLSKSAPVTINSSSNGIGNAGTITIQGHASMPAGDDGTPEVSVPVAGPIELNDVELTTTATDVGQGGTILLRGDQAVTLTDTTLSTNVHNAADDNTSEARGDINIDTPGKLTIMGGGLTAETSGTRDAGSVTLRVNTLETNPGMARVELSSSSNSQDPSAGNAGQVTIEGLNSPVPGLIQLTRTDITTEATFGQGGTILIDGSNTTILDSSTVSAKVIDGGKNGGNITINGGQSNSQNPNFGNEQLLLRNGTTISAQSEGTGNAGDISLQAGGTLRLTDSDITTEATEASGGRIKLDADFMIHLLNSGIVSSIEGNDQDTSGGDINLDPEFIIVQNSQILAQAQAGTGGNIDLTGNLVLVDPLSTIDATSQLGVSGVVNISSPLQNLSGAIAPLPETIIQTATLYGAQCAAQKGGAFSSLNLRGRDRIPFEPGDYLLTPMLSNNLTDSMLKKTAASRMAHRFGLPSLEPLPTTTTPGSRSQMSFHSGC